MNLSKIKDIILKNKKLIIIWVFALLVLSPEISFATETDTTKQIDNVLDIFTYGVNLILILASTFMSVLTILIWWFLTPEWTTWSIFGMTTYLKDIWVLVSNIVYFIFAFLLIVIAFMNILWKWWEWELKQALPRFIIWVLIVPFSWFFIQFILSISSILTVSVLGLPQDSFLQYSEKLSDIKICKEYNIDFKTIWNSLSNTISDNNVNAINDSKLFNCPDDKKGKLSEILSSNPYGILNVYSFAIMNIQDSIEISKENNTNGIKRTVDLTLKILFDIWFIIIYFILLMTLALVMMVRWFYMWIFMMISPVFWLLFFFKKEPEWLKNFTIIKFLWLAMVPVYVAAAFAFGLVFIVTVSQKSEVVDPQATAVNAAINSWSIILWTWSWQIKITMTWLWEWTKEAIDIGATWLAQWKGILGKFIMEIFGVVIMWMAVMAALKTDELTKEVYSPIVEFGSSVWKLTKSAPSYLPIFGGQSAAWLQNARSSFQGTIHSNMTRKWWDFWTEFATKLTWESSDTIKLINKLDRSWIIDFTKTASAQVQQYTPEALQWLVKATNETDFNALIKKLKELKILDEKVNLNFGNRLNASFGNQVEYSINKDVKNNSSWVLSDTGDVMKIIEKAQQEGWATEKPKTWDTTTTSTTINVNLWWNSQHTIDLTNKIKDWKINDANIKNIASELSKNWNIVNITEEEFIKNLESSLNNSWVKEREIPIIAEKVANLIKTSWNKQFKT